MTIPVIISPENPGTEISLRQTWDMQGIAVSAVSSQVELLSTMPPTDESICVAEKIGIRLGRLFYNIGSDVGEGHKYMQYAIFTGTKDLPQPVKVVIARAATEAHIVSGFKHVKAFEGAENV